MKIMKTNIVNYFDDNDYADPIERVIDIGGKLLGLEGQSINIILVDNEEIHSLNRQYRDKDYPTDVLTFPDGYLHHLGDVFIAMETCAEQAERLGHSFRRELGFLTVHGFLHTLGYDHQTIEDEKVMVDLQEQILYKANLHR